ncbi:ulp1 protease family, C-terminal catalytic domain-containing protein [Tanacetum coccineum]
MERKWMYGMNINDPEYVNGVQSFLIAAESDRVAKGNIEIFYLCLECKNFVPYDDIKMIEFHLLKYGFVRKYTCWSKNGESLVDNSTSSHVSNAHENNESYINDRHENMLHDLEANDAVLELLKLKASSSWSDTSFTKLWKVKVEQPMSSHPSTTEPAEPKQTQEDLIKEWLDRVKYRPRSMQGSVK